jgi:hypothetical protein
VELEECYDWASVLRTFDNYLDILQRELSVVDPWENAKKYADKLHAVPQTSVHNLPLSGKEKDDIQKTLGEIKHLLLGHVKNDEKKQQYLTDQFGMLHDAVTKFGKKDYLMLVCSSKVLADVFPYLVMPVGPVVAGFRAPSRLDDERCCDS